MIYEMTMRWRREKGQLILKVYGFRWGRSMRHRWR
jgi:hypothetical protein